MKKEILSVFTMLILTLALAVETARAQSTNQVTASIPFQFTIGNQTLPAGDYTVKLVNQDSGKNALLIKSTDGSVSRMLMMNTAQKGSATAKASLVFNQYGDRYFLAEVWTGSDQFGLTLPRSRSEREIERELARQINDSDMARREQRQRVSVALVKSR